MNELALFAGGGGGLLGGKLLGFKTVCYVEHEPYCTEIIKARIKDGYLDDAPIWDDAKTFDGYPWAGCVDIVTAGFPCQPFSVAGLQLGESDERNLWPATIRIIREVGPGLVFLENTPGLLADPYFGYVLGSLAESGYDCRWDCVPASAIGACHQRDRVWIIAHSRSKRLPFGERVLPRGKETDPSVETFKWWLSEPGMDRVVDGLAHRVDRIKALGNGQVPGVVKVFWDLMRENRVD